MHRKNNGGTHVPAVCNGHSICRCFSDRSTALMIVGRAAMRPPMTAATVRAVVLPQRGENHGDH